MTVSMLARVAGTLLGVVAFGGATFGQCGVGFVAARGGETTAVALVDTNLLIVGNGLNVDLLRYTNVNAPPTKVASVRMDAPIVKLAAPPASNRAYVLTEDGRITQLVVFVSGQIVTFTRGESVGDPFDSFIDMIANASQVYAVERSFFSTGQPLTPVVESTLQVFDFSGAAPVLVSTMMPLAPEYEYDRLTRVGNRVWAGFHRKESNIYGLDAIDYSTPASPVRAGTSLNFIPLGQTTSVTGIATVGTNVVLSYRNQGEDWMRAADTSNPVSVTWHPAVDLNSFAERIAVIGTQLHVAVGAAGTSVWNAANPAALSWLGTTIIAGGHVHDVAAITGTNYTAAGYAGLHTLDSTVPGNMVDRSLTTSLPADAAAARQYGTRTVVSDVGTSSLRIFDYSLAPGSQAIGNVAIAPSSQLELSVQPGGAYACVCNNRTIQVVDINNAAAPFVRGSITLAGASSISQLAASGARLYAADSSNVLSIIDLSNPAAPVVRSTTPLATSPGIRSMAAWANALAIAWDSRGVWLFDTTSATSPAFAASWNPGDEYRAVSVVKGPNALYISSLVAPNGGFIVGRLEGLDVGSLSSPGLMWSRTDVSPDLSTWLGSLAYAGSAAGPFVVASSFLGNNVEPVRVFDVSDAAGAPEIGRFGVWDCNRRAAISADGSKAYLPLADAGVVELSLPMEWAPVFGGPPNTSHVCLGQTAVIALPAPAVSARPAATLRWYRNGVAMSDGPTPWGSIVSGSTSATLTVSNARPLDRGSYFCLATNTCDATAGGFSSIGLCVADFNCSMTVTVQDIFDFLAAYFAGNASADLNGGGVGVQDIFDFLAAYFAGC